MNRMSAQFLRLFLFTVTIFGPTIAGAASVIPVGTPSFEIAGPATTQMIPNTQVSTISILVTPVNGFIGGVHLQCGPDKSKPNYLKAPLCNFSLFVNTVTITSTASASAQLSFAPQGFALPLAASPAGTTESAKTDAGFMAKSAMLLSAIVFCLPRRRTSGALLLLLAVTMTPLGCGGSAARTPPGTYSYTITGYDTATGTVHSSSEISIQVVN